MKRSVQELGTIKKIFPDTPWKINTKEPKNHLNFSKEHHLPHGPFLLGSMLVFRFFMAIPKVFSAWDPRDSEGGPQHNKNPTQNQAPEGDSIPSLGKFSS